MASAAGLVRRGTSEAGIRGHHWQALGRARQSHSFPAGVAHAQSGNLELGLGSDRPWCSATGLRTGSHNARVWCRNPWPPRVHTPLLFPSCSALGQQGHQRQVGHWEQGSGLLSEGWTQDAEGVCTADAIRARRGLGRDCMAASARRNSSGGEKPAKKERPPLIAEHGPLDILYEDEHILVLNKEPGIKHEPVHRFVGGSLINQLVGYLGFEPFTVHRLDMFTSGVVCFAKHSDAAKRLHVQFRAAPTGDSMEPSSTAASHAATEQTLRKRYLVLVHGCPEQRVFSVDASIARHPNHKFARRVPPCDGEGAPALTHFTVLSTNSASSVSLLEAMPQTGRTHQIRVHLQHAGLPVLGDHIYGAFSTVSMGPGTLDSAPLPLATSFAQPGMAAEEEREKWREAAGLIRLAPRDALLEQVLGEGERLPITRQALHASDLAIRHPMNHQVLTFQAPLAPDIVAAAQSCGVAIP